jgi:hypothetical protein
LPGYTNVKKRAFYGNKVIKASETAKTTPANFRQKGWPVKEDCRDKGQIIVQETRCQAQAQIQ